MRRIVTLALLLCGVRIGAQVATPIAPLSVPIQGTVVDAVSNLPLPRVRVVVGADDIGTYDPGAAAVFTDERGHFSLSTPDVPSLVLRARKASFLPGTLTVLRADAARGGEVQLALTRAAAISGRVHDRVGSLMAGAVVIARPAEGIGSGAEQLVLTETDDRGEYRLSGLRAGRYTVVTGLRFVPREQSLNETRARNLTEAQPSPPVDLRAGDQIAIADLIAVSPIIMARQGPPADAPDERGTGAIRGRVTTSAGRPLAGVTVRLSANGLSARSDTTNETGAFSVDELPAATFTLEASKVGYSTLQYGQTRGGEGATPIVIGRGQRVEGVNLMLPGGSAVSGRIVDDHGEPLEGITVRVLQLRTLDGRTTALSVANVRTRPTDDRGMFRLFGLLPGRYLVAAATDSQIIGTDAGSAGTYPPMFYPGSVRVAEATPLLVTEERDINDIDFVLTRGSTYRVTGTALDAAGKPSGGRAAVLLGVSQRSGATIPEPRAVAAATDGTFTFDSVPSGDYVVQMLAVAPDAPPLDVKPGQPIPVWPPTDFGMQYVTVDNRDPLPVVVEASGGATIEGRVLFEGDARASAGIRVGPVPSEFDHSFVLGSGFHAVLMTDAEHFRIERVTGPRRFVLFDADSTMYLKSVVVNGVETTDTPFDFGLKAASYRDVDIVIASGAASLTGRVIDDRGAAVGNCPVIVLPVDRARWFGQSQWMKLVRSSDDGAFSVSGLPPGPYRIAAVRAVGGSSEYADDWQSREVLDAVASLGTSITLGDGERAVRVIKAVSN